LVGNTGWMNEYGPSRSGEHTGKGLDGESLAK
jgi:hypothetical protein